MSSLHKPLLSPSFWSTGLSRRLALITLCFLSIAPPSPLGAQIKKPASIGAIGKKANSSPPLKPLALLPAPQAATMPFGLNLVGKQGVIQPSDVERVGEAQFKKQLVVLKSSGATHTQIVLKWSEVEKSRGKYDWKSTDRLVSLIQAQGLIITATLQSSPNWADPRRLSSNTASGGKSDFPGSEQNADLSALAAELGRRYQGGIHRWVFGKTSGNLTSAAASLYLKSFGAFYEGVKKTDLLSQVAVDNPLLLYAAGRKALFDAVAISLSDQRALSASGAVAFSGVDRMSQLLNSHGDNARRIWLDVSPADPTYPESPAAAVTHGMQAKRLKSVITEIGRRPSIESSILANLNDTNDKSPNSESKTTGLTTLDLLPKLAFRVFQEAAYRFPVGKPARRLSLSGGFSNADEAKATHLDLDVNLISGGMPRIWFGANLESSSKRSLEEMKSTLGELNKANANWIRLDANRLLEEFQSPGAGQKTPDWQRLDAYFKELATQQSSVILAFRPNPNQTLQEWEAQVSALAEQYGKKTGYSVYRWEFVGRIDEVKTWYPAFVKTVQKSVPYRPVGFVLGGESPVKAIEELSRVCRLTRTPINSFSWNLPLQVKRVAPQLLEIRAALAKNPLFKDVSLLPTLPLSEGESSRNTLAKSLRALDFAPPEQPNSFNGFFTSLSETNLTQGTLTPLGEALALLNRVRGGRLSADTDDSAVRCIAAKGDAKTTLLIWRENDNPTESRGANPIVIRLHGLAGGVHVERFEATEPNLRSASDLPGGEKDGEVSLRLKPSGVTLLEMTLLKTSALEIALGPVRKQAFSGETLEFATTIRNTTAAPRSADIELSTSGEGLPETAPILTTITAIPANSERAVRFRVKLPVVKQDVQALISLKLGGVIRASSSLKLLTPIVAELLTQRVDLPDAIRPARFEILLKNRTQSPLIVKVNTLVDDQKRLTQIALKPGASEKSTIQISAPNLDSGLNPVEIGVDTGGSRVKTLHSVIGIPVNCRYTTRKPSFRGVISEWSEAALLSLIRPNQVHKAGWAGPADLSAYVYLLWDEQFFYVACDVQDDIFVSPTSLDEMLKGDSVQFALSVNRGLGGEAGYATGDHEFGMSLLNATQPTLARLAGGSARDLTLRGAKLSIKRDGTHTIYEAAIPWSELAPAKADAGSLLGFSLLVNDNDGAGSGYIAFGNGINPEKRPLLFPPIRLVKPR